LTAAGNTEIRAAAVPGTQTANRTLVLVCTGDAAPATVVCYGP
jgi:hypothetical protein